jgi:hypothetical protein
MFELVNDGKPPILIFIFKPATVCHAGAAIDQIGL